MGPVEADAAGLVLRIPLVEGGRELARSARGIGRVEGDQLIVRVPAFLAENLRIGQGSLVVVDNLEGKFRMTRSELNDF